MNLCDELFATAERQPDHDAIVGPRPDQRWSYQDLARHVRRVASELAAAGIRAGDTIALHVPSGRDYIVLTYALWARGAAVVPIATELPAAERDEVLSVIGVDAVLTTEKTAAELGGADARVVVIGDGFVIVPSAEPARHPAGFLDLEPAFLRFSSGTTGTSKGVVLSHGSVFERIHAANAALRIGPDDRVVWLLSMSYHFTVSIVAYLTFGASIVLCRNHFGKSIVETAHRERATLIYGSPVHYELMAHSGAPESLDELRLAISTATALPEENAEAFARRFDLALTEAYGIIEIGLPCINTRDRTERSDASVGSVGRPLPDYELRLRDVGLGSDLCAIDVRGKGILDAYYEPFRVRDEVLADGWFETGDLGYLDDLGLLHIEGRSKELINTAGMKFFPVEVERALEAHVMVAQACVEPIFDSRRGEVPRARIVLAEGFLPADAEATLHSYCAERLAPHKVPEQLVFVSDIPRTASGKVMRRKPTSPTKEQQNEPGRRASYPYRPSPPSR